MRGQGRGHKAAFSLPQSQRRAKHWVKGSLGPHGKSHLFIYTFVYPSNEHAQRGTICHLEIQDTPSRRGEGQTNRRLCSGVGAVWELTERNRSTDSTIQDHSSKRSPDMSDEHLNWICSSPQSIPWAPKAVVSFNTHTDHWEYLTKMQILIQQAKHRAKHRAWDLRFWWGF